MHFFSLFLVHARTQFSIAFDMHSKRLRLLLLMRLSSLILLIIIFFAAQQKYEQHRLQRHFSQLSSLCPSILIIFTYFSSAKKIIVCVAHVILYICCFCCCCPISSFYIPAIEIVFKLLIYTVFGLLCNCVHFVKKWFFAHNWRWLSHWQQATVIAYICCMP